MAKKTAKKTATENWSDLQRLQALRTKLEEDLERKKLSEVDREAVFKQLTVVRKSISRIVVR